MAKLTLNDLTNLQNEATAVGTINNNSASTETALENTLSRDGTTPNQMEAVLDMNSNRIINLPEASSDTEPVRKSEFEETISNIQLGELALPLHVFEGGTERTSLGTNAVLIGRETLPVEMVTGTQGMVLTAKTGQLPAFVLGEVNVKTYGVLGDGVTNDTANVQNAITNTPSRTLYFPAGTYMLDHIDLVSNIKLKGDGIGKTIFKCRSEPAAGTDWFYGNTLTNVEIEGITFDGNNFLFNLDSSHYPNAVPCIYFVGGNRIYIHSCEFIKWDTCGILTNTAYEVTIRNCRVARETSHSGYIDNATTASDGAISASSTSFTSASANFQVGDVGKNIYIEGAGPVGVERLVTTITARNSATNITIALAASTTVSNAVYGYGVLPVANAAISIAGTGEIDSGNARDCLVDGNLVINSSIAVSGHDNTISNNIVHGHAFGAGIFTSGLVSNFNMSIIGNLIFDGRRSQDTAGAYPGGIENWAHSSIVSNNVCHNCWGPGISMGGKAIYANNMCYNNGQGTTSAGISAFYQDATFNCNGSLVIGNRCYDIQTPKTQAYGYTEHTNLGGGNGSDINLIGNDFSGNLTGDVLLQSMTRTSNMASTVTVHSGGFIGGSFTALGNLSLTNSGFQTNLVMGGTNTANRTVTINPNDGDRTISLNQNVTFDGAFITSGGQTLTLTTTAPTNVTLPTTGTLATRAGVETLTNKTLTAPSITNVTISSGNISGLTTMAVNNGGFNQGIGASGTLTANRTLSFDIDDADRTLTVSSSTSVGKGQYLGTDTNDNAAAGNIGEYQTGSLGSTALTSATAINMGTITNLPAGDWDVVGMVTFTGQGTTQVNYLQASLSSVSGTIDTAADRDNVLVYPQTTIYGITNKATCMIGPARFSLASAANVYLVARSAFAAGTSNASGKIWARRVR